MEACSLGLKTICDSTAHFFTAALDVCMPPSPPLSPLHILGFVSHDIPFPGSTVIVPEASFGCEWQSQGRPGEVLQAQLDPGQLIAAVLPCNLIYLPLAGSSFCDSLRRGDVAAGCSRFTSCQFSRKKTSPPQHLQVNPREGFEGPSPAPTACSLWASHCFHGDSDFWLTHSRLHPSTRGWCVCA